VIEGRVEIPQPRRVAPLPRYPNQAIQPGPPEARRAAVYLEGTFPAPSTKTVRMAQKELQFEPGLLVIQRGTSVLFPNQDDLYHNVFSYSKAKRFDLGRYRKDEKPAVQTFDRVGVVRLSCEIHEHMDGTILVVDTPYFQKTDADGAFRLDGLPTGRFVLKAWVSEKQVYERPVELTPGARLRVDFGHR
jgi:plastocyanin